MENGDFDEKIEKANKALDVMKKFGDIFGGIKELPSAPNFSLDPHNYSYEISEKLDKVLANQVIIIADIRSVEKKINLDQQIKDLIAYVNKEQFVMVTGESKSNYLHADEILKRLEKLL